VHGGFASGTFISSLKDSNPAAGLAAQWTTLSWTASTPPGTAVQFQVAASNAESGPFNFVGTDGTAATFFTTSGASLSQFSGLRYLKYKAFLATTSDTVTPTVSDVTVCFAVDCSGAAQPVISHPSPQACASSTNTASGPAG